MVADRPKIRSKSSEAEDSPGISAAQIDAVKWPRSGSGILIEEKTRPALTIGRPYLVSKDDLDLARRVNDHLAPRGLAVRAIDGQPHTIATNRATTFVCPSYILVSQRNRGRYPMGQLKEEIKGNANEAVGKVKQESGNPDTRAEGKMQEEKGELQEDKGKLEGALGNDV